jgi:excisionase family DNA binding protein
MAKDMIAQPEEITVNWQQPGPVSTQLVEDSCGILPSQLPSETPPLMNVEEAARVLRISRNAAYALIAEDRLPAIRLGKRLIVPRSGIERLIAEALRR